MLPDLSVFWVIFFVLVLSFILDRLVFRPVLNVIKQREEAAASARVLAEKAAEEARVAGEEFERKTAEARADVYRQMDEMRRAGMDERTALVEETREGSGADARRRARQLERDVRGRPGAARAEADSLATDAAGRILGRRAS